MSTAHLPPEATPVALDVAHLPAAGRRGRRRTRPFTRRASVSAVRTHADGAEDIVRPAPWLEELWDRHATGVYNFAFALLGDETSAAQALRLGMTDLGVMDAPDASGDGAAHRSWTRNVYARSQELAATSAEPVGAEPLSASTAWFPLPRLQRACVALCLFGGHTYREVAQLLDVSPMAVAELLTCGLRDAGTWPGPASAAHA